MLSAIKELAESRPEEKKEHMATYMYLKACSLLFEEGILSEKQVLSTSSPVLVNMRDGYQYFSDWKTSISFLMPGMPQFLYTCT